MRLLHAALLASGLALSLGVAAGCAEEPACAADTDCAAGQRCDGGSCVELDLGLACTTVADCPAGEVCLNGRCRVPEAPPDQVPCLRESDSACAEDEVCAPLEGVCAPGTSCAALLVCQPPVGERPGRFACRANAECRSGACVNGSCLAPCTSDASCPKGFVCRTAPLADGATVDGCFGVTLEGRDAPAQTSCNGDVDCAEGRVCTFYGSEPEFASGWGFGVCRERRLDATPTGGPCEWEGDSASCQGNLCEDQCRGDDVALCVTFACTTPCEDDSDCEFPRVCVTRLYGDSDKIPVASCALPVGGCFDSLDCCPARDEAGACVGGWVTHVQVCGLDRQGGVPRVICMPPDDVGRPCDADADCGTGLCTAAGSTGSCTVVCDPARADCGAFLAGSSCAPLSRERSPGSGDLLFLHACQ